MTAEPVQEQLPLRERAPELVRTALVCLVILIAVAAALAPLVYLMRRLGVG